ncbi:GT2 family glycosyltransferase [Salana multivorans]|uniref:GT2 family glycosyltransferase n=1 Tax=Salana multivorans TaxID=120377 RepID=A0A3N2D8H2_9MICO|nr:glycosyltransferase [Salana multivorans]ROR95754.1 GT2 family glycosyltransferase [Salana multivorans]
MSPSPEAPPEHGSVAAVVVTFNRRRKLERTIAALRASEVRPDAIIVVNNASTDDTAELLASIAEDGDVIVLELPENVGGAGGFAAGLQEGWRLGFDWFWIMDDDCYPEPPALRRLLEEHRAVEAHTGARVPFSCSLVQAVDGALCEMNEAVTTWDWPRPLLAGFNAVRVRECTFVSVLFPADVVETIGLPLVEYFIWFDDKEYTKRATRRFGPGLQVLDSRVVHDMGVNRGVDYGRITDSDLWKFRYGARNQASYRWHHEGEPSYQEYATRVQDRMARANLPEHLQETMREALAEGKTFNPQPRQVRDRLPWDEAIVEAEAGLG